jgi:hypothetical protein
MRYNSKKAKDSRYRKGVLFFSASSLQHAEWLLDYGIQDILISYHYILKNVKKALRIMEEVKRRGGIFMTDSGVFSYLVEYMNSDDASVKEESYWIGKVEDYVSFVQENKDLIYVCANFDLDSLVGRYVVDQWNEKYFKPLEKITNVVYLAHKDATGGDYADPTGFVRLKQYLREHEYVGVNNLWDRDCKKVAALAKMHKRRIHGFALTSPVELLANPFFSHDSTTWLGALRYGETYTFDGKNFKAKPKEMKYLRKVQKRKFIKKGFSMEKLAKEDNFTLGMHSLMAWEGLRDRYEQAAYLKLNTKTVKSYDLRT